MTAEATASAGASLTSQWHAIDWQAARRHVRRLQMRIAKATRGGRVIRDGLCHGLSGVFGNRHAPFLGGWGLATAPGYPGVPSMFNSLEVKVLYPT